MGWRKYEPKKRRVERNTYRSCQGKVRYRDKKEATQALKRISGNSTRAKAPRRSYYCSMCKGWHLTSREDRYGQVG